MFDTDKRIKRGEIRQKIGIAIINPYGGFWADEVFDTPELAREYLKKNYPTNSKQSEFKFAMAVMTIELYRKPGEPEYV
jgi:hypothetical protein